MNASDRSSPLVMCRMLDRNDVDWADVTREVKLDLAQRIFDAREGHVPSHYRKMLEHVMGAPFCRLAMAVDLKSGRVVEVDVVSEGTAAAMAFASARMIAA